MGGDDFDDLVFVERGLEVAGNGEVPGLAFPLREGLVGDEPDEVAEERVLPALGGERVGLHGQDLLAHE